MKITTKQLLEASQCLRYHSFNKDSPIILPIKEEVDITTQVIKKSYLHMLETGFRPDWKRIIGWVDKLVFRDINTDEAIEKNRQVAEYILLFLRRWYNDILLKEQIEAFPSVQLTNQIDSLIIGTEIPIVKLLTIPTILTIDNVVQQDWQLYNNLEVRAQIWMLSESLQVKAINYQRLTIGPQGGFTENLIHVDYNGLLRTRQIIEQVSRQIYKQQNYPSVGDHCLKCVFHRRCRI